jgi:hypothetical protein
MMNPTTFPTGRLSMTDTEWLGCCGPGAKEDQRCQDSLIRA